MYPGRIYYSNLVVITYTSFVVRLHMLNIGPGHKDVFVKVECDEIVGGVGITCG